ncbi:hypothetical protein UFOVP372_45 [uncultured Caudovirales phage]|uniref:Uncharacterized protein n=1 Tax=uncultured Caudovirales phage TaxID=2100421 RepID=A0A6J7X6W4_9CAUD|nr:hypothetical protein UFOVP372_45 [uncultured Caudovirales phage]
MLEKVTVVDRIEVVESGVVQVRVCTRIMEDGKQISGTFHRHVVVPGADYSAEDARVKVICAATHTADIVAAYKAKLAEQQIPAA